MEIHRASRLLTAIMGIFCLQVSWSQNNGPAWPGSFWDYDAFCQNDGYCDRFSPPPGIELSKKDIKEEIELCEKQFNAPNILSCVKSWSTSPATMIYQVDFAALHEFQSKLNIANLPLNKEDFEQHWLCRKKRPLLIKPFVKKVAKYKYSVAGSGTSALYSNMITGYYHMARLLDTQIVVPVSVYRSTDMRVHRNTVTKRALHHISSAQMIGRGWRAVKAFEDLAIKETSEGNFGNRNTASANSMVPWRMTVEHQGLLHGVLVDDKGDRYGRDINSHLYSAGPSARYNAFTSTKPFLDLKGKTVSPRVSAFQHARWKRDMSEMAILDAIFLQQDRPWNVDFKWKWFWKSGDKVKSKKVNIDFFEYSASSNIDYDYNQRKALLAIKNRIVKNYIEKYVELGTPILSSDELDLKLDVPSDEDDCDINYDYPQLSDRFKFISYSEVQEVVEQVKQKFRPLRLLQHFRDKEDACRWKNLVPPKAMMKAVVKKVNHSIQRGIYSAAEILADPSVIAIYPIQVTHLNDNDAGMLQVKKGPSSSGAESIDGNKLFRTVRDIKEYHPKTKANLAKIAEELKRPNSLLYTHFQTQIGLTQRQFERMVKNVLIVNELVQSSTEGFDVKSSLPEFIKH